MGVVIERTGGPELPDLRQIGAHMHKFQAMNDRKAFRIGLAGGNRSDQFDCLEAVVVEEPLVRFGPAAFQRVAEQDRRSPSRLHELALVRAIFRRLNRKALAGLALYRETQNAGCVLAEEDVEDARAGRHDLLRRKDLLLAKRRPELFFELGRRRTCRP